MRRLLPLDRMALPPPRRALYRSGGLDMRRDAGRSPAATVLRAKVVLTAIALAAAVALVAVASWPLKALVVLAFVRGVFASDLMAFRNAPRRRSREFLTRKRPRHDPEPQLHALRDPVRHVLHTFHGLSGEASVQGVFQSGYPAREMPGGETGHVQMRPERVPGVPARME